MESTETEHAESRGGMVSDMGYGDMGYGEEAGGMEEGDMGYGNDDGSY